jgi:FKBP-type peptidyl-prolyl cis-trans isomerase
MRRTLAVTAIVPVLAALAVAGCSSSSPGTASGAPTVIGQTQDAGADASVKVSGEFGKTPAVTIPAAKAGSGLAVETIIQGTGSALTSSQSFVANYVVYTWNGTGHKLAANSYSGNPVLMSADSMLPGLQKAMTGKPVGSRVLAVIPPVDAYGSTGDPSEGVTASTTLVFVVDVLGAYANNASATGTQVPAGSGLPTVSNTTGAAPKITIPGNAPPKTLVSKTLIQGTGPKVVSGQYIVVQYTGMIWRTGKVFASSWSSGQPQGLEIDQPEGVIVGWDIGLTGQNVGSRVLLVIPPDDGYGPKGQSQAGIKGTDTLVFVIDILGAY